MILSFPVQNEPIFYHLHEASKQLTEPVFEKTKDTMKSAAHKSKNIFLKLFNNISPNETPKSSSRKRPRRTKDQDLSDYTQEEKELLKKVLSQK